MFNILGPLTNPAAVRHQLTGAFSREWLRPMAETLMRLGTESAWVVHGADGTDEVSITGASHVVELCSGEIGEREVHPEEAGLPAHPLEAILGGSLEDNTAALRGLLDGVPGAYADAVALNAAAALLIVGRAGSLREGVEIARESVASGAAKAKVAALARVTREAAA